MNEHAKLAIAALEQFRSDDLYRAKSAFRNRTPEQMNEVWSGNGETCAEVLKGYQDREDRVDAAINWIKTIKE